MSFLGRETGKAVSLGRRCGGTYAALRAKLLASALLAEFFLPLKEFLFSPTLCLFMLARPCFAPFCSVFLSSCGLERAILPTGAKAGRVAPESPARRRKSRWRKEAGGTAFPFFGSRGMVLLLPRPPKPRAFSARLRPGAAGIFYACASLGRGKAAGLFGPRWRTFSPLFLFCFNFPRAGSGLCYHALSGLSLFLYIICMRLRFQGGPKACGGNGAM